ncbi:hypothetical protein SAMN07250955_106203 [Arboricoccus pini]|uniref:Uncharacterized protein n=1 Tax=Arboricoccus pini TaxID=1963835 RepID=A0A212R8I4_9PROT|nr:hypothetical protein SAMN07250955_106203 [Arboricoccus pini]
MIHGFTFEPSDPQEHGEFVTCNGTLDSPLRIEGINRELDFTFRKGDRRVVTRVTLGRVRVDVTLPDDEFEEVNERVRAPNGLPLRAAVMNVIDTQPYDRALRTVPPGEPEIDNIRTLTAPSK